MDAFFAQAIFAEAKILARFAPDQRVTTLDIFTAASVVLRKHNSEKATYAKQIALLASSYRTSREFSRGSEVQYTVGDIHDALETL